MGKTRAFWFHYNKPVSLTAGRPQISVHYRGRCHIVDNIECRVTTRGRVRKKQPRFVVAGVCRNMSVVDGVAIIT